MVSFTVPSVTTKLQSCQINVLLFLVPIYVRCIIFVCMYGSRWFPLHHPSRTDAASGGGVHVSLSDFCRVYYLWYDDVSITISRIMIFCDLLFVCAALLHYGDVIMGAIASQVTSLTIVYSTVYSDADQRKHQSSASLAFPREFTGDRWIPRTNGQ